jgi:SulP family sulfate permease
MLVPQGMAYAMLAGLDPITGLYAAALPTAIYALMGTSRVLAVGPVAMVSLLVAGAVAPIAGADPILYAAYAALLMLLVGALQFGMGIARLGFLVKYLSHPVIAGFTSAAALIIGFSQLGHILGVPIGRSHHIHTILLSAIEQASAIHVATLAIAVATIATLMVWKKAAPRFPRFLFVVAGGTLAVWGLDLGASGVATVGTVPAGLPSLAIPAIDLNALEALIPSALAIALVGFMESIAVAKSFARQGGYDVDADQELRALGMANIGGAFFQGYPVTGGFSRTAVNAEAGAQTTVAGLVTAVVVALALLFLTPLFFHMPKAVLAGIIMTAVFGLIDVREAKHLWKVARPDLVLMGITFFATLTLGIELGIGVGVGASLLWFVISNAKPHVAVLGRVPDSTIYRNLKRYPGATVTDGVIALRIDGPLFFANTVFLSDTVTGLVEKSSDAISAVIIDAGAIGSVDASGAAAVVDLGASLKNRNIALWLSTVRGPVLDALIACGIHDAVPMNHIVASVRDAIVRIGQEKSLP